MSWLMMDGDGGWYQLLGRLDEITGMEVISKNHGRGRTWRNMVKQALVFDRVGQCLLRVLHTL
jgi:hypothetical protein